MFQLLIQSTGSAGNAADLDFGEVLSMALVLLVVLATAHLENGDLGMTALRDYLRCDLGTGEEGGTDLDRFTFADHKYLIESNFSAYISRYLFYFDFFTSSDAILLAAGFYDRIHDGDSNWLKHEVEAKSRAL